MIRFGLMTLVLCFFACDSLPEFDPRATPPAPECSERGAPGPCPGEQLCLEGRCFEPCIMDGECSARETCQDGICIDVGGDPDGGAPFDAGLPDEPCDGECTDEQVCDLRTESCVSCVDGADCEAGLVCDYARGECVEPITPIGQCSACDENTACGPGVTCTLRPLFTERVCLTECSDALPCPAGYVCRADLCEPAFGGCTQLRRGLTSAACEANADCVARSEAVAPGTCSMSGTCRAACDAEVGCPTGWMCGADGFCAVTMTP